MESCKKDKILIISAVRGKGAKLAYSKKSHGRTAVQSTVGYFGLTGQIFSVLYGRDHSFDRKKSSQIGGVRGNNDESEKPPSRTHDSGRGCLKKNFPE